jgi:multicomponent Na+:H+ antiporter subunit E
VKRRVGRFLGVAVGCTALWCAWSESIAPQTILTGAAFSVLALFLTSRFLLRDSYASRFLLPPITVLRYLGVLFVEIFRSGVHAIAVTLTGRMNVGVVRIPTELRNPLHGTLVANAITLTPGTVTIDYQEDEFTVVWIEARAGDSREIGDDIKGRFERVFLPREHGGQPAEPQPGDGMQPGGGT